MSRPIHALAVVLGIAAGAAHAQSPAAPPPLTAPPVVTIVTAPTPASPEMNRLMTTSQQLRDAIQALAGKPPGTERDIAIAKAQEALLRTQQAMRDLPAEYRASTASAIPPRGYDASVRTLMGAADSLRQAIHAMAREPAGERRNQAIREANRALLDTQVAMANAYDATAFPARGTATTTLGAGPSHCIWLGSMWGCR
jgi:hypothetical protein